MSDALVRELTNPGPHTAETLAERLPYFPAEAIQQALEMLADQGVLERTETEDGQTAYRYVAPERYVQHNLDVARDPARRENRRPR